MTNTLPVILAVLCFWLRSVTATPVFEYAVDPVNVNMLQSQVKPKEKFNDEDDEDDEDDEENEMDEEFCY